mmetsp:Transcript_108175/g.316318  ORF Transcript_108175/g.316318 Transcript_108175/m.316318 type:complete len:487 (+) Transcript_108175:120-1580(+)
MAPDANPSATSVSEDTTRQPPRSAEQKKHRAELERMRVQERRRQARELSEQKAAAALQRWHSQDTGSHDCGHSRSGRRGQDASSHNRSYSHDEDISGKQLSYDIAMELKPPSWEAECLAVIASCLCMLFGPRFGMLPAAAVLVRGLPAQERVEVCAGSSSFLIRGNPSVVWKGSSAAPRGSQVQWCAWPCTPTVCPFGAVFHGAVLPRSAASSSSSAPHGGGACLPALVPAELMHGFNSQRFVRLGAPPAVPAEEEQQVYAVLYDIVTVHEGRRVKQVGCNIGKLIREAAGGFHIGVRCGPNEFTYCAFSGKGLTILGAASSGVVLHASGCPGSAFVFREQQSLGMMRPSAVHEQASKMGADVAWARGQYSKAFHIGGNFCDCLCWSVDLPSASKGWTQLVSQCKAVATAAESNLAAAAEATVDALRSGAATSIEFSRLLSTKHQMDVLDEAANLLRMGKDSDDDEDENDEDLPFLAKALGSLSIL